MSVAKRLMEEQDDRRRIATDIAVESGVLTRCEFHDTVYDSLSGDNTPAYKLGNYKLSSGKLNGVFSDSRQMTDAVKDAIEDAGVECYACAKFRSE